MPKKRHYSSRSLAVATAISVPVVLALTDVAMATPLSPAEEDYQLKLLGKHVFFDKISEPSRMACASCHDPRWGWTGNNTHINSTQVGITGANPHTKGGLKPPSNAYASEIQDFGQCPPGILAVAQECGGNFWNGRAEGRSFTDGGQMFPAGATKHVDVEVFQGDVGLQLAYSEYLGPVADQAINPMPNPVEQNIERQAVCEHVAKQKYAALYQEVWNEPIDCGANLVAIKADDVDAESEFDISFKRLAVAMSAYQHSAEVNSFSSKRDIELALDADGQFPLDGFTDQENLGHDLFYTDFLNPLTTEDGRTIVTNCSLCHSDSPGFVFGPPIPGVERDDGTEPKQLYADDGFHNIGVPKNPELPANLGLVDHTGNAGHTGTFKTPTLRNVGKKLSGGVTKAYTHNGYFKTLDSIIHFYNTAETKPKCEALFPDRSEFPESFALANDCWPEPETGGPTSSRGLLFGNIGMTTEEEAAIVAYLKTLSDTETPKAPKPYAPGKNQ